MRSDIRKPVVSVLYSPGTNCEEETMAAFKLAGADPQLLFLDDLRKDRKKVADCDLFSIPGGFSFGDHIDEGIVVATLVKELLLELANAGKPCIFICNGFQIAARAGLFGSNVTLTKNDSGVFVSRPVDHVVPASKCIWTKGLAGEVLRFPCAHGAGKVVFEQMPNVSLLYANYSPNGGDIAGICSDDGLLFGLMDHPERPFGNEDGLKIFRNGVSAVK